MRLCVFVYAEGLIPPGDYRDGCGIACCGLEYMSHCGVVVMFKENGFSNRMNCKHFADESISIVVLF